MRSYTLLMFKVLAQLLSAMAAGPGLRAQRVDGLPQLIHFALLPLDLPVLLFDLGLLFLESVNKDEAQAVILHAFDFALIVVGHKQRIYLLHVFRAEAD